MARLVLERGPQTAAALAERLDLSPAASGATSTRSSPTACSPSRGPVRAQRGRGRPARVYALTDAGRAAFPHAYDDLATTALRYLRETGGEHAVVAFAEHRAETLAADLRERIDRRCDVGHSGRRAGRGR